MNPDAFLALDDFEEAARKFLPRPLFGYVSGGAETDTSVRANREAYGSFAFVTRVLRDISVRSISRQLLGHTYTAPFGIAPMGISALTAYRGDLVLARACAAANIPMIMSGASLIRLEEVAAANPNAWFQAYLLAEPKDISLMLARVERAGFKTLVVTVDTQARANRENNIRAGFSTPLRPSLSLAWDSITRPRWLIGVFLRTLLLHGMPHFENSSPVRGAPVLSSRAVRDFAGRSKMTWDNIRRIRDEWDGHLVLKGLLSAEDVAIARDHGVDAVVLSNHGGRQLDGAIAPLFLLPEAVAAARGMPVIVDGGIRRGGDVVKALALGAAFVLVGRPFAYAASVAGEAGVARGIKLLAAEVDRNIGMLGYSTLAQIDRKCLRPIDPTPAQMKAKRTLAPVT